MFAPKKILVPTDFSSYSDKALEEAITIAKSNKSKVYLLHVVNIMRQCTIEYCMDAAKISELEQESVNYSKEQFKKQLDRIAESKDVDVIADVRKGNPYEEILNEQTREGIDLIVISSHGTTGLLHFLIGSVAEKVTKGAKCPVLLLRS